MSHQGILQSLACRTGPSILVSYVGKHFAGKKVAVAYEAGPTGWGLYDRLSREGHVCVVAAPSMIPKVRGKE